MRGVSPYCYLQTERAILFYMSLQTFNVLEIDLSMKDDMPLAAWRSFIQGVSRVVSSISHVLFHRSQAALSRYLLRPSPMRYTTTTGSLLSTPSTGCGIPTASADLLLPTPASCIQRDAAGSGLLLPATAR